MGSLITQTIKAPAIVVNLLTEEEKKLVNLIGKIAVLNTLTKAYEAKKSDTIPENINR